MNPSGNGLRGLAPSLRARLRHAARASARWALDVARGYTRVADGIEGVARAMQFGAAHRGEWAERYADTSLDAIREITRSREDPGPLGVGARLALTDRELRTLRCAAEEMRAEALAHQGQAGAEA